MAKDRAVERDGSGGQQKDNNDSQIPAAEICACCLRLGGLRPLAARSARFPQRLRAAHFADPA